MVNPSVRPLRNAEPSSAGAGPVAAHDPVLEPAALARLAELDPKGENHLLERVLQAFKTSAARLALQLEGARRARDLASIRLVAHTIKSSSASIGALGLSQLCANVELLIRLETTDDLDARLDEMSAALDDTLHAIDALLKGPR